MLYIILGLAVVFFAYMQIETRMLSITRQKIGEGKEQADFRIAFLSDIHIGKMYVNLETLSEKIRKEKADCIALGGDYIERVRHIDKFVRFLVAINPDKLPVLLVWGNHDYKAIKDDGGSLEEFREKVIKAGVDVLDNQSKVFEKGGKKYRIIGIPDKYAGKPDLQKAFSSIDKSEDKVIVLSHNPQIMYDIKDYEFDVLLSGHFHGPQVYTPFAIEFRSFRKETIARDGGIIRGLHKVEDRNIYIHRGVGNVFLPFRFCSNPELAMIEFE